MPPKRVAIQPARRQQKPEGYLTTIYQTLTSEDNASVVISVAMFGVSDSLMCTSGSVDTKIDLNLFTDQNYRRLSLS